jgi:quercetin dioxygenase-like cupin family protein
MNITRSSLDTQKGPADWFTGNVYIDAVAAPEASARTGSALVHFTPGARTAWHTHPHGQTIYVTEGVGRGQHEGGPIEEIRPGDRIYFEPGENTATAQPPNRFRFTSPSRKPTRPAAPSPGAAMSPTRSTARQRHSSSEATSQHESKVARNFHPSPRISPRAWPVIRTGRRPVASRSASARSGRSLLAICTQTGGRARLRLASVLAMLQSLR